MKARVWVSVVFSDMLILVSDDSAIQFSIEVRLDPALAINNCCGFLFFPHFFFCEVQIIDRQQNRHWLKYIQLAKPKTKNLLRAYNIFPQELFFFFFIFIWLPNIDTVIIIFYAYMTPFTQTVTGSTAPTHLRTAQKGFWLAWERGPCRQRCALCIQWVCMKCSRCHASSPVISWQYFKLLGGTLWNECAYNIHKKVAMPPL